MHDATHTAGLSEGGPAAVSVTRQADGATWIESSGTWQQPKRTRKIAILGFAETVKDCPWRDPSWELWGLNGFWRVDKADFGVDVPPERYSLWFDMHTVEYTRAYGKLAGIGDQQYEWLQKPHPFPVLMLDADPQFPSVQAYPVDAVVAKLGRDYFTSTIAYALTLALTLDDVAEIGLWGVDLVHGTEYEQQRPCAEYWIGRAEGLGVKVTVHERSALLNTRGQRYGYSQANPLSAELRKAVGQEIAKLERAIAEHTAKMEQLRGQAHTDDGAAQALRGVLGRLDVWDRGGRV